MDADAREGIAALPQKTPRIFRLVLVGKAEQDAAILKLRIARNLHQNRVLGVTGYAPRRENIDETDAALAQISVGKTRRLRPRERRQIELRHRSADQRGRQKRRVAGIKAKEKQSRQCDKGRNRQEREPSPAAPWHLRRGAHGTSSRVAFAPAILLSASFNAR